MVRRSNSAFRGGFTLVELLVVVAIIGLLISILLPSLSKARANARAVKCGAQIRSVGGAMAQYLTEWYGYYPPSYIYPNADDSYDFANQPNTPINGYQHWSYYLFNRVANLSAFTCPEFPNGGAPRTNPGPDGRDWEAGQVDDNSQTGPNAHMDRQAARMAFTANAAIIPRNKFTPNTQSEGDSGPKTNKFVSQSKIKNQSTVILATEFANNWMAAAKPEGGGHKSKSHRPVTPFWGFAGGGNPYAAGSGFQYGTGQAPWGLVPLEAFTSSSAGAIGSEFPINAVGRHHPGKSTFGGKSYGGSANFVYVDGHVERKPVLETLRDREWGSSYWSISDGNAVAQ